jgi:hypothetical protein
MPEGKKRCLVGVKQDTACNEGRAGQPPMAHTHQGGGKKAD